jgi:anaerobic selenocysteine-containing dehydrogenase
VLPDRVSLEAWGSDVPEPGPGYQTVAFQQPVVDPFGDSRDFGDILLAVAEELGGPVKDQLPWNSMRDALRQGARELFALNRGSLHRGSGDVGTFEDFWVGVLQRGGWWDTGARSTGRAVESPTVSQPAAPEFDGNVDEYPFHLMPFASLSMGDGSGAHLPWLQAMPDPMTTAVWDTWVEINPKRAAELGVREGDVVEVTSPHGAIEAKVYVHPATPPDVVSIPLGQGHSASGQYAEGHGANVLKILGAKTDQETGALAWGATRVQVRYTGRRSRIPKFEGTVVARALEGHPVVQVTKQA